MQQAPGIDPVWSIRPYKEGDIPALVDLANAVARATGDDPQITEADLSRNYSAPGSDPPQQVVVIDGPLPDGLPPGTLLGSGRAFPIQNPETNTTTYRLSFRVHPNLQSTSMEHSITYALLRIVDAYEARKPASDPSQVTIQAITFSTNTKGMALWESLGMQSVHAFYLMHRRSSDPIADPVPVEGVEIHNYLRPENNEAVLEAARASFADHFDFNITTFADDWHFWDNAPTLRPDLSWVAEESGSNGKIVSFSIVDVGSEKNPQTGELQALITYVGTIREWRGKGLAKNLLLRCLHSLRAARIEDVLLSVDATSLTGANRLYESVGFTPKQIAYQYECPLSEIKR